MYINEALRARTPDQPCIHRRAWDETLFPGRKICIDPTSEWVCCIAYGVDGLIGPSWNPQAADLLAEDWEPCPRPPVPDVSEKMAAVPSKKKSLFGSIFDRIAGRS